MPSNKLRRTSLMIFYKEEDRPVASANSSFMKTTPCLRTCSHARGNGDKKRATKNAIGPSATNSVCRHFWSDVFRRRFFVRGGAFLNKGSFLRSLSWRRWRFSLLSFKMLLAPRFWSRNTKIDLPNKKKDRKVRSQTPKKKDVALKRTGF